MTLEQTTDYGLVREILTCPPIYPRMGDDSIPPREEFRVNDHPLARYVVAANGSGPFGLFCLFPVNTICWDLHGCMLPGAETEEKWSAARALLPWLKTHTICKRLVTAVPEPRRLAIVYVTHGIGMKYAGRHPKAFLAHGELRDLILFGAPV